MTQLEAVFSALLHLGTATSSDVYKQLEGRIGKKAIQSYLASLSRSGLAQVVKISGRARTYKPRVTVYPAKKESLAAKVFKVLSEEGPASSRDVYARLKESDKTVTLSQVQNSMAWLKDSKKVIDVGDTYCWESKSRVFVWAVNDGINIPAVREKISHNRPACFPTEQAWQEWRKLNVANVHFCMDCTVEYKQKMMNKGLCERHLEGERE